MTGPTPDASDDDWREARVPVKGEGMRLDRFLTEAFPRWSRKQVTRVIRSGQVEVNGARGKPGQRLVRGDRLRLPVMHKAVAAQEAERDAARQVTQEEHVLSEVHRDADLLVLDKPAGLAVHGGAGIIDRTLIEHMREDVLAGFGLVHRLDRSTTGCIAMVRGEDARRRTIEAFQDPEGPVQKVYEAITSGAPKDEEGEIDLPLLPPGHRGQARVDVERGKPARTRWRVMERFPRAARLELTLLTGRTHQIRVHLAAMGWPLLVDPLYGGRRGWTIPDPRGVRPARLSRTPLHARTLTLPHPTSGEVTTARAAVPPDMRYALEILRAVAASGRARGGLPPPPGS